jgi:hypothetical protein
MLTEAMPESCARGVVGGQLFADINSVAQQHASSIVTVAS